MCLVVYDGAPLSTLRWEIRYEEGIGVLRGLEFLLLYLRDWQFNGPAALVEFLFYVFRALRGKL